MEYKKIEVASYNLNLIKTDKFKTILIKFVFRSDIKKEEITIRNFLLEMLSTSGKNYPTKRLMNIKRQELYDLGVFSSNKRIGNQVSSEITFQLLDPKYSNSNIINDTILFIKDIIFNPNVKDNAFDSKLFKETYNILESNINEGKSYSKHYSLVRMKEIMGSNMPFSYNNDGYIDDLLKITKESLYEYYQNFINNSLIDIYVVGDINFYDIEKLIKENISFKTIKKPKKDIMINFSNDRKKINEIKEDSSFNQSRLAIGCSFKELTDIERKYTLVLYNIILGNSPESKLFKNIREKESLCYDISSVYNKNDNIMFITTGIDYLKYDFVKNEIIKVLKSFTIGEFNNEDIVNAKKMVISSLESFEDYPSSIIEYYFSLDYLNSEKIEKIIENINKITKEDIINVSKKVKIDTIFLLEEKNNEGN